MLTLVKLFKGYYISAYVYTNLREVSKQHLKLGLLPRGCFFFIILTPSNEFNCNNETNKAICSITPLFSY